MFLSKGKLLAYSIKPNLILCSVRASTLPQGVINSESSPVKKEKPKKEPFMKNVFLGKFHDDFLYFSAQNKVDRFQELKLLFNTFCEQQSDTEQSDLKCLRFLAENGFFCFNIPLENGGIEATYSELLKLYEDLALKPSLAVLLELQAALIIPALIKHGSKCHKDNYLKKLLNGEITGAYAMSEENSGSDPSAVNSNAVERNNNFILNGEKFWVTNALSADFYIVFANVDIENLGGKNGELFKDLSVFLVDKSGSLQVKEHNLLGLNNCDIGKVNFLNHLIPKENLLGELGDGFKIAGDGLSSHKFIILTSILSCLKNITSTLTIYINKRKQFPRDLKDCELIKKKLATIVSVAYCLESMLYFTCYLLDNYSIDTSLESSLLQIYGFEKGLQAVMECLDLLGSRSYDKSFEYEKLLRDFKGLKLFATNTDIAKLYSSLIGLDHAGKQLNELIKKNRNPFNYPGFMFKKLINDHRSAKGNPKLGLKLYMNLHPSLKDSADKLEYCVWRLKYVAELLLSRHGSEVVNRQLELQRLADVALNIFMMTSVLSRASHSYCTGIRFCDEELMMAKSICFESFNRSKKKIDEIIDTNNLVNDSVCLGLGSNILNKQSYYFENPHNSCV